MLDGLMPSALTLSDCDFTECRALEAEDVPLPYLVYYTGIASCCPATQYKYWPGTLSVIRVVPREPCMHAQTCPRICNCSTRFRIRNIRI